MIVYNIKKIISGYLNKVKYYQCLPALQKNSDVYIVEFPKSGITWLSTIIANTNLIHSGSRQRATYFNIQQLIPDIHMGKNLDMHSVWTEPHNRFIKSHCEYCPNYQNVVYLVRDPVSVMNSYYHYCKMLKLFDGDFKQFVTDSQFGIENWVSHIDGWLFRGDSSQRIHVIKYEDLIENPVVTLVSLYKNLGVAVTEDTLNEAVERSKFSNMKLDEAHYKTHNPNTSLIFMREGSSKVAIPDDVEQMILERTKSIRAKLGY
jgi:hypothetical protein